MKHFVKKMEINDKPFRIEGSGEVTSLECGLGSFTKGSHPANDLGDRISFIIKGMPSGGNKLTLSHPGWFSLKGIDIADLLANITPAYGEDAKAMFDQMVLEFDAAINKGVQTASNDSFSSMVNYAMRDLEWLPWPRETVWYTYKRVGTQDHVIRLIGDTEYETTTRASLAAQPSYSQYWFYSAAASLATSDVVSQLPMYYLSLTGAAIEADLIPVFDDSEFIQVEFQGDLYENGTNLRLKDGDSFSVVGHCTATSGSGGRGTTINISNGTFTAMENTYTAPQGGYVVNGDENFTVQASDTATPDKPAEIKFGTYTCLYKDTLISMADGSLKRIDEIQVGDQVITISGIETVESVHGPDCVPFNSYTVYNIQGHELKVINDHRIYWEGRYRHISTIKDLEKYEVQELCYPYSIYTNKTNTYFANNILCGTCFSNSWLGKNILYPIYSKLFLKAKKLGPVRRWLLKLFLGGRKHGSN